MSAYNYPQRFFVSYIRNFIFGVEDSLVSTVGLLSGIATAGVSRPTIIVTGIVLIFVEAFSMAVGSFLSERSAEEYIARTETPSKSTFISGLIMFFSYFVSGLIPLSPYILLNVNYAFWISIISSLSALFALGLISGKILHLKILKSGLRILIIGGIAVGVGVFVGGFVK